MSVAAQTPAEARQVALHEIQHVCSAAGGVRHPARRPRGDLQGRLSNPVLRAILMTLSDLLQGRYGPMRAPPAPAGLGAHVVEQHNQYADPTLSGLDSETHDTRNIASRIPPSPTGMAGWLQGLAGRIRADSRPDNILAQGLESAGNWLDLNPHTPHDFAFPFGAAGLGALGASAGRQRPAPPWWMRPVPEPQLMDYSRYGGARSPHGLSLSSNLVNHPDYPTGGRNLFHYTINQDSRPIGHALGRIVDRDGRSVAYISHIFTGGGPDSLGVAGLRALREQVRQDFPNVTQFEGHRISGARALHGNNARQAVEMPAHVGAVPVLPFPPQPQDMFDQR